MVNPAPILALTDFSALARHAADRASRVAHEIGSALTVMHVLPGAAMQQLRDLLGTGHALERQIHDDARRDLQQLSGELQLARRVPVDAVVASGAVLDEILRQADAMDAGVLVLGARGAGFLRRLALGTTSERLVRRTHRPVLVVRQTPRGPYRKVMLALDFSPWSMQAVAAARQVAPHAHLTLLHVFDVPFEGKMRYAGVDDATIAYYRDRARVEAQQRMRALARDAGLRASQWDPCVVEGDASRCIVEQEQENDCDLLVLGKHGRSVSHDLLLGSVTKHVLAEGSSDVLVSTARAD